MQYIKHSFFVNFNNAIKYDDEQLMGDLLTDEIAKLSVFDKDSVAKALIGSDVNISKRPNKKELAQKVVKNLDNDVLRKNIIKLIYKNNKALQRMPIKNKKMSAKKIEKVLEKQAKDEADNINKHLFLNFCSSLSADGSEAVIDEKKLNEKISTKVDMHEGNQTTLESHLRPIDSKRLMVILGGIWLFGFIITHVTIWAFKKYEAKKMAEGGAIGDASLIPDVTPELPIEDPSVNVIDGNGVGDGIGDGTQPPIIPEHPQHVQQFQSPVQQYPQPNIDIRQHYEQ